MKKPMHILMVNEVCGITSTGRICTDIADLLSERGDKCHVAYGRGVVPDKDKEYAIKIANDVEVRVHALSSRIFDNAGFASKKASRRLIQNIEKLHPDIIHLHNLHGYYLHIGVLFEYLKEANIPVIWTLHDCWSMTGHCTCSDFIKCDLWKTHCMRCPQKTCYPASYLFDRSKKNHQQKKKTFSGVQNLSIVTPSVWLKQQVQQSYLSEYPVQVIPSGIDTNTFSPKEGENFRKKYHLEDKTILLAVANAWSERKGVQDYVKLANDLNDSYQIVIVGNLRDTIMPSSVLCIDHTNSQKELAEIYSSADVYLNFSYEETQGLTTLEAMACGTPVVVANRTAIPECVDATCGVIIEAYEKSAVLTAINKAKGLNQADCIAQAHKFKKRDRFMDYIDLYERTLNK